MIWAVVTYLSLVNLSDWSAVGIYAGCGVCGRTLYPFFHANLLHCTLNSWCLLSLVFIYDIKIWRLSVAYLIAVTIPIDTLANLLPTLTQPTVGLSGIVFVLFGSISFEVQRKRYYQMWMMFYLGVGFLFPNTNAWLHLYCYLGGLVVATLNKPIVIKR